MFTTHLLLSALVDGYTHRLILIGLYVPIYFKSHHSSILDGAWRNGEKDITKRQMATAPVGY